MFLISFTDTSKAERADLLGRTVWSADLLGTKRLEVPKLDTRSCSAFLGCGASREVLGVAPCLLLLQRVLAQLAWTAQGELFPMAAIVGGVAGQEARKERLCAGYHRCS